MDTIVMPDVSELDLSVITQMMTTVVLADEDIERLNDSYGECQICFERQAEDSVQTFCCGRLYHRDCYRAFLTCMAEDQQKRWFHPRCGHCRAEFPRVSLAEQLAFVSQSAVEAKEAQEAYFKSLRDVSNESLRKIRDYPLKLLKEAATEISHAAAHNSTQLSLSLAHDIMFGGVEHPEERLNYREVLRLLLSILWRFGRSSSNVAALDLWLRYWLNANSAWTILNDIVVLPDLYYLYREQRRPALIVARINERMVADLAEQRRNFEAYGEYLKDDESTSTSRTRKQPVRKYSFFQNLKSSFYVGRLMATVVLMKAFGKIAMRGKKRRAGKPKRRTAPSENITGLANTATHANNVAPSESTAMLTGPAVSYQGTSTHIENVAHPETSVYTEDVTHMEQTTDSFDWDGFIDGLEDLEAEGEGSESDWEDAGAD